MGYYDADAKRWVDEDADETAPLNDPGVFEAPEPVAPAVPASAPAPAPAPGGLTPEQRQELHDSLVSKYRAASDDSDVQAARDGANKTGMATGLISGFANLMNARSVGRGGKALDNSWTKDVNARADRGVDDARAARKDRMEGVLKEDQLDWQGKERDQTQKGWANADDDRTHMLGDRARTDKMNQENDGLRARELDPKSQESIVAQTLAKKMMPQGDFSGMSAAQLKAAIPSLEKLYDTDQRAKELGAKLEAERGGKPMDYVDKDGNKRVGTYKTGKGLVQDETDAIVEPKKPGTDFKDLPMDDQEVVKELGKKNAAKIAIANQIDAVIGKWDKLTDDQKLVQGRQLLKVLNSTEGSDAIGKDEASRLGGKLEFALGNAFNSNPTQFGRDLKGFGEDAKMTSKGLRTAVGANQVEIDKRYHRKAPGEGKPKTVKQNGHTYTLNEATGKYE